MYEALISDNKEKFRVEFFTLRRDTWEEIRRVRTGEKKEVKEDQENLNDSCNGTES